MAIEGPGGSRRIEPLAPPTVASGAPAGSGAARPLTALRRDQLTVSAQAAVGPVRLLEIAPQLGAVMRPTQPDPSAPRTEPPLPLGIVQKTSTEAFTDEYYFALRGGRVYAKPRTGPDGQPPTWQLLNGTGLPGGDFASPARVTEISADSAHLIAIDEQRRVFDGRIGDDGIAWHDTWGLPVPRQVTLPENRGWAVSTRRPTTTYRDRVGHQHPEIVGISTFYVMNRDGTTINYGDPWLPDFNNVIYGPQRGRFVAERMAASGSAVFVINRHGDMYASVQDFDINGRNPGWAPIETYNPNTPNFMRVLDDDPWVRLPKINGRITANVSVVNTGPNARDRQLRVQGVDEHGHGGYYAKPLEGGDWTFVQTGQRVDGPFLDNRPENSEALTQAPSRDVTLSGHITHRGGLPMTAQLTQFNPECSPARLQVQLGGETFELPVHFRNIYLKSLNVATIEVPQAMAESQNPAVRRFIADVLNGHQFYNVQLDIDAHSVRLRDDIFRLGAVPIPHNPVHNLQMSFQR